MNRRGEGAGVGRGGAGRRGEGGEGLEECLILVSDEDPTSHNDFQFQL